MYPLLGLRQFPRWTFTGSDIDPLAVHSASSVLAANRIPPEQVCVVMVPSSAALQVYTLAYTRWLDY